MRPFRPREYPPDRCVTGPHLVTDAGGNTRLVFRCELCGVESREPSLLRGCWECDGSVMWR